MCVCVCVCGIDINSCPCVCVCVGCICVSMRAWLFDDPVGYHRWQLFEPNELPVEKNEIWRNYNIDNPCQSQTEVAIIRPDHPPSNNSIISVISSLNLLSHRLAFAKTITTLPADICPSAAMVHTLYRRRVSITRPYWHICVTGISVGCSPLGSVIH